MLTRVRTVWPRGLAPTGQNLRDLDQNTAQAVDGHDGGTYSPSSPIVVSGDAGLVITTSSIASALIPSTKSLTFGKGTSDDAFLYSEWHDDRSRSLLRIIDEVWTASGDGALIIGQSVTAQVRTPGARFFVPLRVFDEATLESVTFRWKVGSSHANVPEHLPRFRVVRVGLDGQIDPLRAEDASTSRDGWVVWGPRPSTGANYYNSGAVKTMTYECNQSHVIDRASFHYLGEVEDERGAGAWSGSGDGNFFLSTVSSNINIEHLKLRQ